MIQKPRKGIAPELIEMIKRSAAPDPYTRDVRTTPPLGELGRPDPMPPQGIGRRIMQGAGRMLHSAINPYGALVDNIHGTFSDQSVPRGNDYRSPRQMLPHPSAPSDALNAALKIVFGDEEQPHEHMEYNSGVPRSVRSMGHTRDRTTPRINRWKF